MSFIRLLRHKERALALNVLGKYGLAEQGSRGAREPGSREVDERNIFEPVCFVEAGFVMLVVGKGFCQ